MKNPAWKKRNAPKNEKEWLVEKRRNAMLEGLREKKSLDATWKWENIAPERSIFIRMPGSHVEETRLKCDTMPKNLDDEVSGLRKECERLRQVVEDLMLRNQVLQKRLTGLGWSCE